MKTETETKQIMNSGFFEGFHDFISKFIVLFVDLRKTT